MLMDFFIKKYDDENRKQITGISADARDLLMRYNYPGNVRELENIIERSFALGSEKVIEERDLLLVPVEHDKSSNAALSNKFPLPKYLDNVERQALLEALEQTGFNRTAAAKLLGLTFRTMRYRMERLGIKDPHGDEKPESGHPAEDAD